MKEAPFAFAIRKPALASRCWSFPAKERAEFMAGYKAAAGFATENLNKAPRTIPNGARANIAG